MRLCSFFGTAIRIHPMFLLMLFSLLLFGEGSLLCLYLLTLLSHESGHYIAAKKLHVPVAQIEFTPFGGSMQIHLPEALPPWQAFLLSAAGPAANIVCLLAGAIVCINMPAPPEWLLYFLSLHIGMLLINLIPVLPLDGGRMILAVLSRFFNRVFLLRILLSAGRLVSVVLIVWGLYTTYTARISTAPCVLGVYLLYASALEEKNSTSRYLAAFMTRRVRLEKNASIPVQHVAASADMPLFMLIPHLRPGAYHIVTVLDPDGSTALGQLCEETLLSAVLHSGSLSLGELASIKQERLFVFSS